jgi:hypothetical protein
MKGSKIMQKNCCSGECSCSQLTLEELPAGTLATIAAILPKSCGRKKFADVGLVPGTVHRSSRTIWQFDQSKGDEKQYDSSQNCSSISREVFFNQDKNALSNISLNGSL